MRIKNKAALTSHGNIEGRKIIAELLDAGLDALIPYYRVKEFIKLKGSTLILDNRDYEMKNDPHSGAEILNLNDYDRVYVIGAAKGVQLAALAMEEILGRFLTAGHVIDKHGEAIICKKIGVTLAGHPIPDDFCVEGCKKIADIARDITERDLVFTITGSGCGSLMTYPAGDITIRDVASFTRMMQIEKGVPTGDLNRVRTHIDKFKGGRITRLFKSATLIHMTTADPSKMTTPVIRASYFDMLRDNTFFPTLASASTYADAIEAIKKWDAWEKAPASIKNYLLAGNPNNENMTFEEYEATGSRLFGLIFKDTTVYPTVRKKAKELGCECLMLSEYMQAEAREAGYVNSLMALNVERMNEPFKKPVILMTSGENVVTVGDETGVGGRNQEYCMAAAINIKGSKHIVFGAVDTDGTDGPGGLKYLGAPECLAGAIIDGYTFDEAQKAGINLWNALKTHGTSEPLWKLGCGIDAEKGVSALDLGLILIM